MASSKKSKLDCLLRIISLCETVERKGINPFEVEVKEALASIRQHLYQWKSFEEFCLDAAAVNNLSKVIKLQGDWVKHRSSLLYADPAMVESKLRRMSLDGIANTFLKAWHPVVQMERLSPQRLKEAIRYWNTLPSRREGVDDFLNRPTEAFGYMSKEDLTQLKLVAERDFNRTLMEFSEELAERVGRKGRISYWDFIYADTYEELVVRAYFTSFLLTYGYAVAEVDPLKEDILLSPRSKPEEPPARGEASSIPIPIDHMRWQELREKKRFE